MWVRCGVGCCVVTDGAVGGGYVFSFSWGARFMRTSIHSIQSFDESKSLDDKDKKNQQYVYE